MLNILLWIAIALVILGVVWSIWRETPMAVERRNRKAARRTERKRDAG